MHLLFLFSLARICLGQCGQSTCSWTVVLPNPVTNHGAGWSFPDQGPDDYRQLVWEFQIDDGDFVISWSNPFQFGFQATMLGPDGITSTTFSIGAASQTTLRGSQWIPGAEDWLGEAVKVTLVYTRPITLRRLKLGRSSSLIESRQNSCTTCANLSNV